MHRDFEVNIKQESGEKIVENVLSNNSDTSIDENSSHTASLIVSDADLSCATICIFPFSLSDHLSSTLYSYMLQPIVLPELKALSGIL